MSLPNTISLSDWNSKYKKREYEATPQDRKKARMTHKRTGGSRKVGSWKYAREREKRKINREISCLTQKGEIIRGTLKLQKNINTK